MYIYIYIYEGSPPKKSRKEPSGDYFIGGDDSEDSINIIIIIMQPLPRGLFPGRTLTLTKRLAPLSRIKKKKEKKVSI